MDLIVDMGRVEQRIMERLAGVVRIEMDMGKVEQLVMAKAARTPSNKTV